MIGNFGSGEWLFRLRGNGSIPAKGERLERGPWLGTNVYLLSPLFPKAIADWLNGLSMSTEQV